MGKILQTIKNEGLFYTLKKIIYRNYRKTLILRLNKDNFSKENFSNLSEYSMERIEKNIVKKIDLDKRKEEIFMKRLDDKEVEGFLLRDKDFNIYGYIWIMYGKIYEGNTGFSKKLEKDEAYIYDIYIYDKFRGQGLGKSMVKEILIYLFNKDIKRIYYFVNNLNKLSIKLAINLGFNKCGKMTYLDINNKRKIISVNL